MVKDERDKDIKESADEIVDSFVEVTKDLPTEEETYYSLENLNVFRPDGKPTPENDLKSFRELFLKLMPDSDEEGNLKVEVAKWTK